MKYYEQLNVNKLGNIDELVNFEKTQTTKDDSRKIDLNRPIKEKGLN